jgi:prephenate dehydrogenase
MFPTPPSITIIGFGAFGQLVASLLAPHASVSIFEHSKRAGREALKRGFRIVKHAGDISAEIVILAVPVQALGECLHEIAPHLRAGQLVVDVCSIKEEPARLMRETLPPYVEILASHPMFGPESARKRLAGSQIVFCPIRGKRWRHLAVFLRFLQFDVVVTTPEDHDRQAAMTQGLTHLLARALSSLEMHPRIRTRSFELMSEALALVANDAPEVFEAVTLRNQHMASLRERLLQALAPPANQQ